MMKKLLILTLPLATVCSVHATLIISNGNFEADGSTGNSQTVSSWFEELGTGSTGSGADTSEQVLDADANTNIPGSNNMWGHIVDKDDNSLGLPAIYQSIGIWNTGDATSYTLSGVLGDRSNQPFGALTFKFLTGDATATSPADGTAYATAFTNIVTLAEDTTPTLDGGAGILTQAYSNTFNMVGLSDGDEVYLRIVMLGSNTGSAGTQRHSLIDDLSITAVPEPSTYALLAGLFTLGLVAFRRRIRD